MTSSKKEKDKVIKNILLPITVIILGVLFMKEQMTAFYFIAGSMIGFIIGNIYGLIEGLEIVNKNK